MIRQTNSRPRFRVACLLLSVLFASACTDKQDVDYCKNHYEFHEGHRDTLGTLDISMTVGGLLSSEFSLPAGSSPDIDHLSEQLRHPNNIYTLQTDRECEAPSATVRQADDLITAIYESRCGPDNKISQLDILLFDTLAGIEEVEVTVTTAATQKHFLINRRCESAIFRVD